MFWASSMHIRLHPSSALSLALSIISRFTRPYFRSVVALIQPACVIESPQNHLHRYIHAVVDVSQNPFRKMISNTALRPMICICILLLAASIVYVSAKYSSAKSRVHRSVRPVQCSDDCVIDSEPIKCGLWATTAYIVKLCRRPKTKPFKRAPSDMISR